MVSRRKILSRSRDELHSDIYFTHDEEDDIWHNKSKLYQDHIQEVMDKWDSIDDEIWAKIIVLERNRRVAKAYARAPVLTLNGSDEGFDGFRIGVGGFENPHRDPGTDAAIRQIGMGCKLKMDDIGNILIKRITKSPVKVKNINEDSAVSNEILKLPGGVLDFEKPFKVFDMKKFQQNVNRELKRTYPDRAKLETQCISVVSFGTGEIDVLDCPVWILVINIVAVEMIRSKLPQVSPRIRPHSLDSRPMTNGPTSMRPFGSGSSDEDPYSVAGSGSSGSSGGNAVNNRSRSRDKPPKLPPRDTNIYGPKLWAKPAEPEQKKKGKQRSGGEDPYYSGLRARIPNFVKSRKKKQKEAAAAAASKSSPAVGAPSSLPPQIPTHPFWWHSRLYSDNQISLGPGMEAEKVQYQRNPTNFMPYVTDSSDSDYSHIYGRLGMAGRGGAGGMRKFPAKPLFMSRWE